MKKLLFILAAGLLPISANAQMRLDFDADAYYGEPVAATSSTGDHQAKGSDTSQDKARTVRRGERTVMLAEDLAGARGDQAQRTTTSNPY